MQRIALPILLVLAPAAVLFACARAPKNDAVVTNVDPNTISTTTFEDGNCGEPDAGLPPEPGAPDHTIVEEDHDRIAITYTKIERPIVARNGGEPGPHGRGHTPDAPTGISGRSAALRVPR